MRLKKIPALAAALVAMLAVAGPVHAQNPTQQGYSQPGGVVQTQVENGGNDNGNGGGSSADTPAAVTAAESDGSLPFTGLDLALIVGAGVLLLGSGLAIRRASRPSRAV